MADQLVGGINTEYPMCTLDAHKDMQFLYNRTNPNAVFECPDVDLFICNRAELDKLSISAITQGYEPVFFDGTNCVEPVPGGTDESWIYGCNPGFAAPLDFYVDPSLENLAVTFNSTAVPARTGSASTACCQGFYCPAGLSCMIPCPLGSYCPSPVSVTYSGTCGKYGYRPVGGPSSKGCGGADLWSLISTSITPISTLSDLSTTSASSRLSSANESTIVGVFCEAGYYCPNASASIPCPAGSYCRSGSTEPRACSPFTHCPARSSGEHLLFVGFSFLVILAAALLLVYWVLLKLVQLVEDRAHREREQAELAAREEMRMKLLASKVGGQTRSAAGLGGASKRPPAFSGWFSFGYGKAFQLLQEEKSDDNLTSSKRDRVKFPVEIEFQSLSIYLKGTNRCILSDITGKLLPGQVTAVMGPSGAGKTTFLNAVAGKPTGGRKEGKVLVNGREDDLENYKRIIGFVPQDDIVHGDLTVEENLWFSASYRLPVEMKAFEKVAVVERAMEALGLDAIRDSRVGTVEKRGVSGGQRKRVNVGLEMVMAPSLLILDEPTSGLDSTSSRLVVQALLHEASRGVNVTVVLHQPSFQLFNMFNNLILLAKGGRTAYLGPVSQVEVYFNSLGFDVPARLNPADFYMDVLEGMYLPSEDPNFDYTSLPDIWKKRRGQVDRAALLEEQASAERGMLMAQEVVAALHDDVAGLWIGVKDFLRGRKDLSRRKVAGFAQQFVLLTARLTIQRLRDVNMAALDYFILLVAGAALGILSPLNDNALGGIGPMATTTLALGLLCMIAALRTFGGDKLQYYRESASGINKLSFFLAKNFVDLFNTLLKPLFYMLTYFYFCDVRANFFDFYWVALGVMWATTGVGYFFSIVLPPAPAQLTSAIFALVCTQIASKPSLDSGFSSIFYDASFARWAIEGFIVTNAQKYEGVWILTRCAVLESFNYSIRKYAFCIWMLVVYGLVSRFVAFIALLSVNRDKQK